MRPRQRQGDGRQAAGGHDGYQIAAVRRQADDLWRFRESREGVKQPYARAAGPTPDGRAPSRQRINASADASDATIPSPSAGSLEMAAASSAPNAPPAICAKPSRAAATPALLPNGNSAAAFDSGLAMPNPKRKIAVATRKGGNESFAASTASSSAALPMTVIPRPTTVAR